MWVGGMIRERFNSPHSLLSFTLLIFAPLLNSYSYSHFILPSPFFPLPPFTPNISQLYKYLLFSLKLAFFNSFSSSFLLYSFFLIDITILLLLNMTDGKFPTNIEPKYIPYSKDHASLTACANPIPLDLKSLFQIILLLSLLCLVLLPQLVPNNISLII